MKNPFSHGEKKQRNQKVVVVTRGNTESSGTWELLHREGTASIPVGTKARVCKIWRQKVDTWVQLMTEHGQLVTTTLLDGSAEELSQGDTLVCHTRDLARR